MIPLPFLATVKGYVKIGMFDEADCLLQRLAMIGYKQSYYLHSLLQIYLYSLEKKSLFLETAEESARNYVDCFPENGEGWLLLGEILLISSVDNGIKEHLLLQSRDALSRAVTLLESDRKLTEKALASLELVEEISSLKTSLAGCERPIQPELTENYPFIKDCRNFFYRKTV
jgi:hypothetical protein